MFVSDNKELNKHRHRQTEILVNIFQLQITETKIFKGQQSQTYDVITYRAANKADCKQTLKLRLFLIKYKFCLYIKTEFFLENKIFVVILTLFFKNHLRILKMLYK